MSQDITDLEREAGRYTLPFNFGGRPTRGRSLGELLEREPALLLEISRWSRLPKLWPHGARAVDKYCGIERVGNILRLLDEQRRDKPRCRTRTSRTHVEAERQFEFPV